MEYYRSILLCLTLLTLLAGCSDSVDKSRSNTVVLDLTVIAKATGQDEIIKKEIEKASANLNNQLAEVSGSLEEQLKTKKEKIGKKPNKEEQQQFQQLALQANQKLRQTQSLAQVKIKEFEKKLVASWHQKIKPIAQEIAQKKGASVVLVSTPSVIWFDATVDITDEVIAKIRSQSSDVSLDDKTSSRETNTAAVSKK